MSQIHELVARCSQQITSLEEFFNLGTECLFVVMQEVALSPVSSKAYQNYALPVLSESRNYLRPINTDIFIQDSAQLQSYLNDFGRLVENLREIRGDLSGIESGFREFIDTGLIIKSLYTTLQSIGCMLDMSEDKQGARKNFGQRFEDFVKTLLSRLGVASDAFTFQRGIPAISVPYTVQIDLIMNPNGKVSSTRDHIDADDVLLSVKTSSKDRMKQVFIDRYTMGKILGLDRINYIAIYHNDVQRNRTSGIRSTFLSNAYLVFCYVFGELPLYYLDAPVVHTDSRFQGKIKTLDEFILRDVWKR